MMEFEPTEDDLLQLREWIRKMPHIVQNYDDQFLVAFVIAAKGSLQKTKTWLENFNALGMRYPDIFGTLDPMHPPLQESISVWMMFPLPKKTPTGCTVLFMCLNPKLTDASKSHVREFCRYLLLTYYILNWENNVGTGQIQLVNDIKGSSFTHFREITPIIAKQMVTIAESCIPIRIKSIDLFNVPPVLEYIFNLLKSFAKKKLAGRINVYSTIEKLTDDIPEKMLPKEYGGSEESVFILHNIWQRKVESYRQQFLREEQKMKELDPIRPRTDEGDSLGETFRRLNVD